jgi:transposase
MRKVALDLGTRKTTYCEAREGQVVQRATVTAVQSLESLLGPEQPQAVVAIEACREAWYVHDLLTSWGNQVVLVDTTRSRRLGIGQHGRKTDRIDAEVLALALERGGIPVAHVLSPHRRELRRWLGVRRALVESRAQLVTTARGLAREYGTPLPRCVTERFVNNVRKLKDDPELGAALEPVLKMLATTSAELVGVEQALAKLCVTEPIVSWLITAPGVGPVVAASFVSVVDEAKRFRSAHHVQSYLGLVPSEDPAKVSSLDVFPGIRLSCLARAPARGVRREARTGADGWGCFARARALRASEGARTSCDAQGYDAMSTPRDHQKN